MTIKAYAKVNLTLEVLGKRPDGFHALRSVVLPIGLSDTLTFTPADTFSTDTGYPDDLILKATKILASEKQVEGQRWKVEGGRSKMEGGTKDDKLLCSTFGLQPPTSNLQPYAIRVAKHIPAGGGLGGGSADAAATLLALNELWHLGKTPEELAAIGAQVGSDVPALVLANHYRAPVLMEGRGEVVSLLNPATGNQQPATKNLSLVLANPGVPCSTAEVYAKCKTPQTSQTSKTISLMRSALASDDINQIAAAMMNDLQPPALEVCPEVGTALAALREAGAVGAMMSGSGSTVFGLVPTRGDGDRIAARLNAHGLRAWSVSALCSASAFSDTQTSLSVAHLSN